MSPNEWNNFNHLFKEKEIPAKTLLLKEGEVSRTMFFIKKGCLRTWINNDGTEITTQFFFEDDSVSAFESFRTNQPSLYSIESIEPCILQTISQENFQHIIDNSLELKNKMEEHLFKRLIHSQKLLYSFLKNNPQKRYGELIEQYPHIIQRIPQHYIASYLGITAVSLSRIRNRR